MSKTSIIYKLISSKTDLIYIGSTTQTLQSRLIGHRKKGNITRAKVLFDYGKEHVSIVELAKFENISKPDLEKKEYEFIQLFHDTIVNLKGTKGYTGLSKVEISKQSRKHDHAVICSFCSAHIASLRNLTVHHKSKKCLKTQIKTFNFDVIIF